MGLYVFNWPISVLGDWKDISIARVIIIIKSEVSTLPIVIIFSVIGCLRCLLHHILSLIAYTFRENREFVFIIIVQFMISANIRIHFGLQIVLVCLYSTPSHYHHCTNLSEGIELVKCMSDIFSRVCKIKHILSVIHYTICGAVCFQFTHFCCVDWENIYILFLIIIIKSEVWTITHCLGLGHETMVFAVCFSIFLLVYNEYNLKCVCFLVIQFILVSCFVQIMGWYLLPLCRQKDMQHN